MDDIVKRMDDIVISVQKRRMILEPFFKMDDIVNPYKMI